MLTVNELFSGIGSQRAALERLGIEHKVVGIAEIDKFAIKSYEAIWGETKNYGDISKVDKLNYADFWTYSFPCQDISVAGKQAGIKHGKTRSGLLYEVERLLERSLECGELPKYLMLENVKNLVGKKFKAQFEEWIQRLDELGFNTYWQILNAKNYGIPQNRERVFGISIRKDIDTGYVFPEPFELKTRLKDILEKEVDEKHYISNEKTKALTSKLKGNLEIGTLLQERNGTFGKIDARSINGCSPSITSTCYKGPDMIVEPKISCVGNINPSGNGMNGNVFSRDGLSPTITTNKGEGPKILEPLIAASRGRNPENPSDGTAGSPTEQRLEINQNGTSNAITTVQKDNLVLEPSILQLARGFNKGGEHQLSPSITSHSWECNNFVKIKQATKEGYIERNVPGVADLSFPDSETRRGRVQENGEVCPTLMAGRQDICYIEPSVNESSRKDIKEKEKYCEYCGNKLERKRFNGRLEDFGVFNKRKYCNRDCMKKSYVMVGKNNQSWSTAHATARKINELFLNKDSCEICGSEQSLDIHHIDGDWQNNNLDNLMCLCRSCHMKHERYGDKNNNYRIRKLTPLETWRLMGFTDEQFYKAEKVNSNSQLYKQAGNSIVVDVLYCIFKNLFVDKPTANRVIEVDQLPAQMNIMDFIGGTR